jgi:hypothetical protein
MVLAYDSLCTACTQIFSDSALDCLHREHETEWKFHSTLESMIESELDGCRLCALVLPSSDAHERPLKRRKMDASTDAQSPKWNYKLALFSKSDSTSVTNREIYVLSFLLDSVDSMPFTACISVIV